MATELRPGWCAETGRRCQDVRAEIERLRAALKPFAEIAERLGWADMDEGDHQLGDHIIEAPADDAPSASYCLMISAFRGAALVLADEQKADRSADERDRDKAEMRRMSDIPGLGTDDAGD